MGGSSGRWISIVTGQMAEAQRMIENTTIDVNDFMNEIPIVLRQFS